MCSTTKHIKSARMNVSKMNQFLARKAFAVVGASAEKSKFGNKLLRCYQQNGKPVVAVNSKSPKGTVTQMENAPCVSTLREIVDLGVLDTLADGEFKGSQSLEGVGISIVTPPAVTAKVLREAYGLGARWFVLQPGSHDATCDEVINAPDMANASIIKDCVLKALGFTGIHD